jgi:hypothetical protein
VVLKQDDRLIVHFIDYGNFEHATVQEVCSLAPDLAVIPWTALQCSLDGVAPAEGNTWSVDTCSRFEELCIEKNLLAEAVCLDDEGVQCLKLLDMGCSVAEQLQQEGRAQAGKTPAAPSLEDEAIKFSRWEESYNAEESVCEASHGVDSAGEVKQLLDFDADLATEASVVDGSGDAPVSTRWDRGHGAILHYSYYLFSFAVNHSLLILIMIRKSIWAGNSIAFVNLNVLTFFIP